MEHIGFILYFIKSDKEISDEQKVTLIPQLCA
jgi:hypothetical protein